MSAPQSSPSAEFQPNLRHQRLDKKRETDRASQRKSRARTKGHIAHLEKLIKILEKGAQSDQVKALTRHAMELHSENEKLKQAISSISKITEEVTLPRKTQNIQGDIMPETSRPLLQATDILHHPPIASHRTSSGPSMSGTIAEIFSANNEIIGGNFTQLMGSPTQSLNPVSEVILRGGNHEFQTSFDVDLATSLLGTQALLRISDPMPPNPSSCSNTFNMFAVVNSILSNVRRYGISSICTDLDQDADISIRAILFGWSVVEENQILDLGWRALRQIDQGVFSACGLVERLAILRLVRLKLRHKICPDDSLARLFPALMCLSDERSHLDLIDFFVWPDFRNLLLSLNIDYVSAEQVALFTANLRFRWPFSLRDIWLRNTETHLYSYSSAFDKSFGDIQSWTLGLEFFMTFPRLLNAIPLSQQSVEIPLAD